MRSVSCTLVVLVLLGMLVLLVPAVSAERGFQLGPTPTPSRTPTPINVGNFVWDDLDKDGRQDGGEPGLAGVTVQLWNGAKNDLIDQTTTNTNGNYTLVAPTPGPYRVRVILPGGGDQFSPKDQAGGEDTLDSDINPTGTDLGFTDIYNFASNLISITSIDAGIIKFRTPTPTRTPTPINVGNFVWHDLNGDGIQDSGEPGIGGVTVQLWDGAVTHLIDQTTTNTNGNYTVVAPLPGEYRVRVLLPGGSTSFSPQDAGSSDLTDSDIRTGAPNFGFTEIIIIASNVISISSIDAGIMGTLPPSPTPTNTFTPSATATQTNTPTITPTGTQTNTPTITPTGTQTNTPTITPTASQTPLLSPSPTGTGTSIFTPTEPSTLTPTATASRTPDLQCATKPAKPILASPEHQAFVTHPRVALDWNDVSCASVYKVLVKRVNRSGILVDKAKVQVSQYKTDPLVPGALHFWRVKACNPPYGCRASEWHEFVIQ